MDESLKSTESSKRTPNSGFCLQLTTWQRIPKVGADNSCCCTLALQTQKPVYTAKNQGQVTWCHHLKCIVIWHLNQDMKWCSYGTALALQTQGRASPTIINVLQHHFITFFETNFRLPSLPSTLEEKITTQKVPKYIHNHKPHAVSQYCAHIPECSFMKNALKIQLSEKNGSNSLFILDTDKIQGCGS